MKSMESGHFDSFAVLNQRFSQLDFLILLG